MKKLLLSLGALSAVVAPVAAVVACGSTDDSTNHGGNFETTAVSTKTQAELSAVKQDSTFGRSDWADALGVDATNISGGSEGGVTTFTWNASDLTLKSVDTNGDVTITTTLTITPAAAVAPTVDAADVKLGKLLSTDLAKNISKTDTVLEDQAKALVAKVVAGPVQTISFNLDDGKLITFDFGADSFLHNGNEVDDKGIVDTGADTVVTFGKYANYISDKLSASFKLEDGKLAAVKTDVNDAAFIKDAKFLIRMIVAAKTNLHYVSNKAWLLA